MDGRARDLGSYGPSNLTASSSTDERGVHEAGGEGFGVAAYDGETFVFEDGPPEAFIQQTVDGIAVDLAFAASGVAEPFGVDRDALGFQGLVRESLGGLPPVLDEPVWGVAAGLIEQGPEFVSVLGVQTAGVGQELQPAQVVRGVWSFSFHRLLQFASQCVVTPPGDVAVGEAPDGGGFGTIERLDDPFTGIAAVEHVRTVFGEVERLPFLRPVAGEHNLLFVIR